MSKIKLDLDSILRDKLVMQDELNKVIERAVAKRVPLVEFVSEKKNGELKKLVLLFLAQPKIKCLYHRVEKDDKNSGRILVHFRLTSKRKKIGLYGY